MRYLLSIAILVMLFCSGFTWGKSKEERCKEANELVFNQQAKNPDSLSSDLEHKVTGLCPGGAAEIFLSGLKYELSNQTDKSMQEYEKVVKIDENFSYAYGRTGLIQLAQNNKPGAMVSLTKALEYGGKNPRYHLALAGLLVGTQAYPLALYHYEKSNLLGIPYNANSFTGMAQAQFGLKNWKEAEYFFRQALVLSPNDLTLKTSLAKTVIHQQRFKEGIQLLKQAIALKPDDKSLHRELADVLSSSGNVVEAKAELQLAGGPAIGENDPLVNQGDALFLRHEFPAAIRSYTNAAEKKATPEIFQKLGDTYLAVGNDDDALGSYLKSLSISPDDADVHYSAGVILERKGDMGRAVSEYERCTALDKNNGDAHRRLAEIYALKGELQKAIAEYQQILVNAHDNPVIYFKLAKVYQRLGKNDEAKQSLVKSIKLDPNNLEPRRDLIKLEIRTKNLPGAEKQCRDILAINKNDPEERKRLIGILGQQKKYDSLIEFLTDESIRHPNDSTTYYRLGVVKEYLKDHRGAIQAFLKSVEIKPTALAYQALARTYLAVSEAKKAREALAEANRLDPRKKDTKELIKIIEEELGHSNAGGSGKSSGKKNHP